MDLIFKRGLIYDYSSRIFLYDDDYREEFYIRDSNLKLSYTARITLGKINQFTNNFKVTGYKFIFNAYPIEASKPIQPSDEESFNRAFMNIAVNLGHYCMIKGRNTELRLHYDPTTIYGGDGWFKTWINRYSRFTFNKVTIVPHYSEYGMILGLDLYNPTYIDRSTARSISLISDIVTNSYSLRYLSHINYKHNTGKIYARLYNVSIALHDISYDGIKNIIDDLVERLDTSVVVTSNIVVLHPQGKGTDILKEVITTYNFKTNTKILINKHD